jgi:hypothetical protein
LKRVDFFLPGNVAQRAQQQRAVTHLSNHAVGRSQRPEVPRGCTPGVVSNEAADMTEIGDAAGIEDEDAYGAAGGPSDTDACIRWLQRQNDFFKDCRDRIIQSISNDYPFFCTALSNALYRLLPDSKSEIVSHLRKKGLVDGDIARVPHKYWKGHGRFAIDPPMIVLSKMLDVYNFFKYLIEPSSGKRFYTIEADNQWKKALVYLMRGLLSDPPGLIHYSYTFSL